MAFTTLNPADLLNGSLSGGNLTFTTAPSAGSTPGVRAFDGKSTGKFYFEVTSTSSGAFGLALIGATFGNLMPGTNATGGAMFQAYAAGGGKRCAVNGSVIYANALGDPLTTSACAVDLTNGLIWFQAQPNGSPGTASWWNNSGTADPGTGVGGISLGALTGSVLYPFITGESLPTVAKSLTANFGSSAFASSVPTGFTAGWPANIPGTPTGLAVSSVTTTTISMTWSASSGATSYGLRYRLLGASTWTTLTGIASTSQTVTGLMPGGFYEFQVDATSAGGDSAFSASVVGQTTPLVQPVPAEPQSLIRYRGAVGINWGGFVLIGDAFSGVVGQADFDSFTEYGNPMEVMMTSPPVHSNRRRVFVDRLEIDVETGVGLSSGQGSDPMWMLDWSKDGARTWIPLQVWRSMGRIGQYLVRLRWLKLGSGRQWVFRLRSTDPVRRVIIGSYIDSREGMS